MARIKYVAIPRPNFGWRVVTRLNARRGVERQIVQVPSTNTLFVPMLMTILLCELRWA